MAAIAPAACSSSGIAAEAQGLRSPAHDAGRARHRATARSPASSSATAPTPPNLLDVPSFPPDAYLSGGQTLSAIPGLANLIPGDDTFINYAFSKLNGFSRIALAIFAVDDPTADAGNYPSAAAAIDPTTLPVAENDCTKSTSSVFLLDLEPNNPGPTQPGVLLPCRAAFHDDRPDSITTPVVAVGPPRGFVLQEGHKYATVITSRVKDTKGRAIGASADFASVAGRNGQGTDRRHVHDGVQSRERGAEDPPRRRRRDHRRDGPLHYDEEDRRALHDAERARKRGGPDARLGRGDDGADGRHPLRQGDWHAAPPRGFTASTDDWLGVVDASGKLADGTDDSDTLLPVRAHDQIAAIGTAVFTAQSYLQVKPTGYADMNNATFAHDANGNPVAQAPVKIWITIALPTTPMPASGYPVVIVQHGLGGSRLFLMDLANTYAKQGWAVAAIDSVTFGARASEAANTVDAKNNFAGAGAGSYTGPDGFADTENGETDFFGALSSMLAICDQFREAGFDTAQVVKVLRSNPDLSPLKTGAAAPAFDPTRIAYLGDSLGAMEGTIAAAIEPRVSGVVLRRQRRLVLHRHRHALAGVRPAPLDRGDDQLRPEQRRLHLVAPRDSSAGDDLRARRSRVVRRVPRDEPPAARRHGDEAAERDPDGRHLGRARHRRRERSRGARRRLQGWRRRTWDRTPT